MFKENENTSMKTEEAKGQHASQVSKMNPFAYLNSTSAKPVTSDQPISNGVEKIEKFPATENLEEEKTMFQENQNSSTETDATNAHIKKLINESEAAGDIPVISDQPISACNEESENSLMRENSTTGDTVKGKKLYNKINNRVKNFANDNKKRVVTLWYWIGEDINNYYEGDYGKSEMKLISDNTGIGISTLYKAVQFAKSFTNDDHNRLLEKDFISFRLIVESFPLGRFRTLEVFESSSNAKEAQLKINEFKRRESDKGTNPDEGTDSKVPDSEKAPDSDVAADTVHEETESETYPDKNEEKMAVKPILTESLKSDANSETTNPPGDEVAKAKVQKEKPSKGVPNEENPEEPASEEDKDESQGTPSDGLAADGDELPDINSMFPHLNQKASIADKKIQVVKLGNDLIRIGQEEPDPETFSTEIERIIAELMALFASDSKTSSKPNTPAPNFG